MDDGSGVMIPLMTLTQHNLRMHHNMGLEAVAAIQQAAQAFAATMNQAAAGVDMLAPESIEFRQAYNDLEAEFGAFMDKVPLSNPMGLQALASEAPRFAEKAARLPPVRKKVHRKPNKVPDVKDEYKVPEPEPEPATRTEETE